MCVQLGSKYCFSSTIPPWIEEQIGFKLSKCHAAHKKDQLKVRMIWIQMKTQLKFTLRLLSLRWHGQKLLGRKKQPGKSGSVKCHSNTDRNETPEDSPSWALPTVKNEAVVKTAKRKLSEDKTVAFCGKADCSHNNNTTFKEFLTSTESHEFETSNLMSH